MKKTLVLLLLISCRLSATHIVGGEMIYDQLGNNQYRVILKVYRDCFNGTASFDGLPNPISTSPVITPAVLTVMQTLDAATSFTLNLGQPVVTKIPASINSPCIQTPNTVCVEEGVYTLTVTLPPVTGGYRLIYQRCCRNNSVLNLLISGNQGATYTAKIPGPEEVLQNSSPRFRSFPPIFLCNNVNFSFDHSAVDPDGDQLVYSLCAAYDGLDVCCASVGGPVSTCPNPPAACPPVATPPPYAQVNYVSPFDGSYPIASNPSVSIHPTSGLLTGRPNLIGQFVVCICVQEIRNGQVIDVHYRDFQFNTVGCVVNLATSVAEQNSRCAGFTFNFLNQSTSDVGQPTYHWDFGVPGLSSDTSNLQDPTYTYQDTGVYELTLVSAINGGCRDTLRKKVYVYPPLDVKYNLPPAQCLRNNAFNFSAAGLFAPQATFSWVFGASASPSVSVLRNPTSVNFSRGGYLPVWLKARQFACRDSFVDSVRIYNRPKALIGPMPSAWCAGVAVDFVNGSYSELPTTSYWQFSNGSSSADFSPRKIFNRAGSFVASLAVTTSSLCADSSVAVSFAFTVHPSPYAGFSCFPEVTSIFEPEILFTDQASLDVFYWQYSFGDGAVSPLGSPRHSYSTFGNYNVQQVVTNRFGCTDTASGLVVVEPEFRFWAPNAFTPDENGLNEVFRPLVYGVDGYSFEIYNGWGRRLFETDQVVAGWDGSYGGKPCPQDVYVWRVSFVNQVTQKKEERSGHVLLLRNR